MWQHSVGAHTSFGDLHSYWRGLVDWRTFVSRSDCDWLRYVVKVAPKHFRSGYNYTEDFLQWNIWTSLQDSPNVKLRRNWVRREGGGPVASFCLATFVMTPPAYLSFRISCANTKRLGNVLTLDIRNTVILRFAGLERYLNTRFFLFRRGQTFQHRQTYIRQMLCNPLASTRTHTKQQPHFIGFQLL